MNHVLMQAHNVNIYVDDIANFQYLMGQSQDIIDIVISFIFIIGWLALMFECYLSLNVYNAFIKFINSYVIINYNVNACN